MKVAMTGQGQGQELDPGPRPMEGVTVLRLGTTGLHLAGATVLHLAGTTDLHLTGTTVLHLAGTTDPHLVGDASLQVEAIPQEIVIVTVGDLET